MDSFEYRPHSSCYEYIVTSLPLLSQNWKENPKLEAEKIVSGIKELCSYKDALLIDMMTKAADSSQLNMDFYAEAAGSANRFIREYFDFDRQMRNCKVRYLNRALGRPETEGIVTLSGEEGVEYLKGKPHRGEEENFDVEDIKLITEVLDRKDLLERENGLDSIMWEKIDRISSFDVFNMNAVLAFIAKLNIINRWLKLDESTGREMFRKLVGEVRATFKGVDFK